MQRYQIKHHDPTYTCVAYGLKFVNGVAITTNSAMATRLKTLGYMVSKIVEPTVTPAVKQKEV